MKIALFSKLRAGWFFGAFVIGLALAYWFGARPEVVVKFPSPKNSGTIVYHGSEACFKLNAEEVACPTDESLVRPQPIQT
jgi:hypothetical protein